MPKKDDGKKKANGEGAITKRPNGTFQVRVSMIGPDGRPRRVTKTAKTEPEAIKLRRQLVADRDKGVLAAPDKSTFAAAADAWLKTQIGLGVRSQSMYAAELGYAKQYIGTKKLGEIKPPVIRALLASLEQHVTKVGKSKKPGRPLSARTKAKVLTRVKAVFRDAKVDQTIMVNPTEGIKRKGKDAPAERGQPFDFEQAARFEELGSQLYAAGLSRLWPALFTGVSIGLRRAEIMGLRLEDVDLTGELIRIRQALSVDDGKPFFTTTKNRETRDIDMPGKLKLVLTRHLEHIQQERQAAGNAWEATDAVFPTVIGRWTHPTYLHATLTDLLLWSDPNNFAKRSEGIRRRVGSQALASLEAAVMSGGSLPKVSPHDLRHTFATLALKSGQDVVDVSEILGHRDVSVTLKFYAHAIKLKEKKTFDLFAAPIPERQLRTVPIA